MPALRERLANFELPPGLAVFLTPSATSLQFAIKGGVAMAVALYISFLLNFDRPYWTLISAIFLQIRPQSGQVIEKGMFQLIGTVVGGSIGLLMMALFVQAPPLALGCMTLLVFLLATMSSMTHNFNFTYLCAMTAVTMNLIVVLTLSTTVSSQHIFEVAVQRVSEIGIGAICATLSSMLLWPQHVQKQMTAHANDVILKTLQTMQLHLEPEDERKDRHGSLVAAINAVELLEADANPVVYEGPTGLGRARAAHLLSQKTLSLIAEIQVLGHVVHEHPDWINEELERLFEAVREAIAEGIKEKDPSKRRQLFVDLRKEMANVSESRLHTALQHRAVQALRESLQQLLVMHDAARAVGDARNVKLKARRISRYYDVLLAVTIGMRSACMFAIGCILWIATGWDVAFLIMVLPVVFSIMFAQRPARMALRAVMVGALIAIPVTLITSGIMLASAPGDYEILVLCFIAPMMLVLPGFSSPPTIGYALGFCLTHIIMTLPSNQQTYALDSALERGLAIVLGVLMLYTLFRIIRDPGPLMMRRRLISSTAGDLAALSLESHDDAETWLNGRMIGRIQRLAAMNDDDSHRNLIEQGLLGLNLGHAIIKQAHRMTLEGDNPRLRAVMRRWQESLARAYQASAWGINDDGRFIELSRLMYQLLRDIPDFSRSRLRLFEGLCYRIALSLRRNAGVSEEQVKQLQSHLLEPGVRASDSELDDPSISTDEALPEDSTDFTHPDNDDAGNSQSSRRREPGIGQRNNDQTRGNENDDDPPSDDNR